MGATRESIHFIARSSTGRSAAGAPANMGQPRALGDTRVAVLCSSDHSHVHRLGGHRNNPAGTGGQAGRTADCGTDRGSTGGVAFASILAVDQLADVDLRRFASDLSLDAGRSRLRGSPPKWRQAVDQSGRDGPATIGTGQGGRRTLDRVVASIQTQSPSASWIGAATAHCAAADGLGVA